VKTEEQKGKTMNHLIRLLALISLTLVAGCSSEIMLSHSPSDMALMMVKPESRLNVSTSIITDVPEPYTYSTDGYSYVFHFDDAFRESYQSYFMTKFTTNPSSQEKVSIDVIADSLVVSYDYHQSTGQVVSAILIGRSSMSAIVNARLYVTLKVIGDSINVTKVFPITSTSNETIASTSHGENLYSRAVDQCINKSIVFVEKYLQGILKES
jgi:hypothetical protein